MSLAPPPGLDPEQLRGLLDRERPGLVRGRCAAGSSRAAGRTSRTRSRTAPPCWVVRRPPLGHVLATAHDMRREHRVISALRDTPVPVPAALLLCEDETVLGAPFYVMEHVDGTPYRTADQLAALGPARTRGAVLNLLDTLVDLHAVDPDEVGLGDSAARRLPGPAAAPLGQAAGRLPGQGPGGHRRTARLLGRSLPASPYATVVHGDYRLDNALIGRTTPCGRSSTGRCPRWATR